MRRLSTGSTWAASPSGWCRANSNRREISVSTEQRENLEAILRRSAFPAVPDVNERRRQLKAFLSAQQTAGIRTIPVLELRRVWPTLLRLAGEVLVTFEE